MEPVLLAEWYTDPFCSWSFAAEASIKIFRQHFGINVSFRHRLFPLYQSIEGFLQHHGMVTQQEFAPKIENVSRATGVTMNPDVWRKSQAPSSSESYCLFAEAALLVDFDRGDRLLSRLRELAFLEARNIGDISLLNVTAETLGISSQTIEEVIKSGAALKALSEDRAQALKEGVSVRPTLVLTNPGGDRVFIGGLRNPELFILAGESLIQEA